MSRGNHAAVTTELATDGFNMVSLLHLGFSVGSPEAGIYLTDAQFDVPYDGNTYLTSGHILKIGDVTESASMRVGTLNITLSAVDQTYVSLFLSTDHIDLQLRYWKAILDDTYAIIGDPILYFDGRIGGFTINESASKSEIPFSSASHWANFDTIAGRKTNSNSQQIHFPGDLFFAFASQNQQNIPWGRK